MKILFVPLSVLAGILAGILSKKFFSVLWGVIEGGEPPNPKHPVEDPVKLAAALVLEGAIVRLLRGGVDHASRRGFARLTGSWPGEENSS
jgi:hypothetical protein